ncbi:hypothetical protein HYFRA_00011126 [Hymenoscyphus fraxineus]|uniref:NACHT domain-containing protein n=1 Tax=Hymenoscyphus fraxineus TaxID=746836 RepID=A0A9N9L3I2_9HELO|nr:hypothetical protein HYFRA_00011126 [Hymenoscyphus fraxineus]
MDPFAAIGFASNLIQFIDYSAKLVNGAREIYDSASGMTEDNRSLESIVTVMGNLSSKIVPPTGSQDSEEDQALFRVASECKIVANQILELIAEIKPKDPKSKGQSTLAAFKGRLRQREMTELEKRLSNCRSQLELQLNLLNRSSSETKGRLEVLISSSDGQSAKLEELQSQIKELNKRISSNLNPGGEQNFPRLMEISEHITCVIAQKRILESLSFEGMHQRFDNVVDAHGNTFQWIFESDTERGIERWASGTESFITWLSSGNGIFHISGKPGSGKSSLMKFLCQHTQTKMSLHRWAGDRKLIFSQFFFWKPGTPAQRSLNGLFRTILFDILKLCPELIQVALPDEWKVETLLQDERHLELTAKQVKESFVRIIKNESLYIRYRYCYFIDGLDEFEETHQDDYKSVVETLISWTKESPNNVKICVSSREYNVFLHGFSKDKRIRLQDLTRSDMEHYIRDKLPIPQARELEILTGQIVEKGNGIFLWVSLVVRALRERLDDGYEQQELEKELDTLPEELEGLFSHLLMSLNRTSRTKTYQLFAMVLAINPFEIRLSPLACSFLEDFLNNQYFALGSDFLYFNMSTTDRVKRTVLAGRRINGSCKGLLESKAWATKENTQGAKSENITTVEFIHRSIPEFLQTPHIEKDMKSYLRNFKTVETVSNLLLAEIRSTELYSIPRMEMCLRLFRILSLREKHNSAPFIYLNVLSSSILMHTKVEDLQEKNLPGIVRFNRGSMGIGFTHGPPVHYQKIRYITSPLLASAVLGQTNFVMWTLKNDGTILDSHYNISALICCCFEATSRGTRPEYFEVPQFFLENGISPQALMHTTSATSGLSVDHGPLTFWVHFLLGAVSRDISFAKPETARLFGKTIEMFLRHEATCQISLCLTGNEKMTVTEINLLQRTLDFYEGGLNLGGRANDSSDVKLNAVFRAGQQRYAFVAAGRVYEYLTRNGGNLSFRQLIKSWDFDNEKDILELVDGNLIEFDNENLVKSRPEVMEEYSLQSNEEVSQPKHPDELRVTPGTSPQSLEIGIRSRWDGKSVFSHSLMFLLGKFLFVMWD